MKKLKKTMNINRNSVERFGYCPVPDCLCYCVSLWQVTRNSTSTDKFNASVKWHQ